MEITISGLGILKKYFPSHENTVKIKECTTVRSLLERLKQSWGKEFYERAVQGNSLAPYIVALHNGLSIDIKKGLDTELNDGDRLIFTFMIDGG